MTKAKQILNATERAQSGWSRVEETIEIRLKRLRADLESVLTDSSRRELLAHRIDELKNVLRLARPDESD